MDGGRGKRQGLFRPPVAAVDVGADVVQLHLVVRPPGLGLEK